MIHSRGRLSGSLSDFNTRIGPFRFDSSEYNPFSRQPSSSRALLEQTVFDSSSPHTLALPVSVPLQPAVSSGFSPRFVDSHGIFEVLSRPAHAIDVVVPAPSTNLYDDSVFNFTPSLSLLIYALVFFSIISFFIVLIVTVYEEFFSKAVRVVRFIIRAHSLFENYRGLFLNYLDSTTATLPVLETIRNNIFPPLDPFAVRFRRNLDWSFCRFRGFSNQNSFGFLFFTFGLFFTHFLFSNRKRFRKFKIILWKRWFGR